MFEKVWQYISPSGKPERVVETVGLEDAWAQLVDQDLLETAMEEAKRIVPQLAQLQSLPPDARASIAALPHTFADWLATEAGIALASEGEVSQLLHALYQQAPDPAQAA